MSAWLSNLLTIPDWSLYLHEALHRPDLMAWLGSVERPYSGVVDTAAGVANLCGDGLPEGAQVTVIDADLDWVKEKCRRYAGRDVDVGMLRGGMERLKERATVYRFEEWDEWIADLYRDHTGLSMDWARYEALMGLNVQNQHFRSRS